jgi:hypothetical protein
MDFWVELGVWCDWRREQSRDTPHFFLCIIFMEVSASNGSSTEGNCMAAAGPALHLQELHV